MDYLRSTREDATLHEVNVLAAWRFLERDDSRAALLFGTNIRRGIRHQVGATLDWPVGRRFFVRVDARLILFRVGIGAGIGFLIKALGCWGDPAKGSGRLVAPSPGIPPAGSGVLLKQEGRGRLRS